MNDDERKVMAWLSGHDAGVSSKSLAFEFLGVDYKDRYPPRDPSDLGRCLRLIKMVPAIRACVDSLALIDENWAKAAKVWDSITKSMIEEVGIDWSSGRKAELTYNMMKRAGL